MPVNQTPRRGRGFAPTFPALLAAGSLALGSDGLSAQSLKGSPASLDRQNQEARAHDFTYLRTAAQVNTFVELGLLVRISGNADYDLHQVSFPYARPEVRTFVERLAAQYRDACGEKLVVTSLTRPINAQPANASDRSVHPTGMAVDLRRPNNTRCRAWLEDVLLQLEGADVLEATRETNPPHYHIVIFPRQYSGYLSRIADRATVTAANLAEEAEEEALLASEEVGEAGDSEATVERAPELTTYRVRRGDSLWTIARKLGTTVERIRAENDLQGNRIYAGQVIVVPGR